MRLRPVLRRSPGRLIAFEGCDGSGKSTQAQLLRRWLAAQGVPVILSSWNSSPAITPAIRRGKSRRALAPVTYSLIHACDFAERLEHVILPHLAAGYVVIADRYAFTGFARDSARGCDLQWVRQLYRFAPLPHLTAYCAIEPATAARRALAARARLKYYESGLDVAPPGRDRRRAFIEFQHRVAERYEALTAEFGFLRLDATQPVPEQQASIRAAVIQLLGGRDGPAEGCADAAPGVGLTEERS